MKRYLSLWFPDWPLTRLRRARRAAKTGSPCPVCVSPDKPAHPPFVLIERGAHGQHVAVASPPALALGIGPGLAFTDARARVPGLLYEEIDRAGDAAALGELARWMIRFAPLVSVDGADGLMLETTGCDHLYGGEPAMLAEISAVLSREGIAHRCGLASTPVAAAALARVGEDGAVMEHGGERAGLADLPISGLRLSDAAETLLRRFGLVRIGQLYGIDRKALARRFQSAARADLVMLRLDQALGLRHDPINPLRPAPALTARLPCPEPLISGDAIRLGLDRLADTLCADLQAFGQGARSFILYAFRADGTAAHVEIRAARPVRAPAHILRLFEERIDQVDPGFGIDLLLLEARRTGPMEQSAVALSGDLSAQDTDPVAISALADRICARLGEGMVRLSQPVERHLPEQSERSVPFESDGTSAPVSDPALSPALSPVAGPRPIRLLRTPERVSVLSEVPDGPPLRFVWRRRVRSVSRADGPERIAPQWWTHVAKTRAASPRARDYYRVEDGAGRRYWLYREGLYEDGRGGAPDWFVHGLFA